MNLKLHFPLFHCDFNAWNHYYPDSSPSTTYSSAEKVNNSGSIFIDGVIFRSWIGNAIYVDRNSNFLVSYCRFFDMSADKMSPIRIIGGNSVHHRVCCFNVSAYVYGGFSSMTGIKDKNCIHDSSYFKVTAHMGSIRCHGGQVDVRQTNISHSLSTNDGCFVFQPSQSSNVNFSFFGNSHSDWRSTFFGYQNFSINNCIFYNNTYTKDDKEFAAVIYFELSIDDDQHNIYVVLDNCLITNNTGARLHGQNLTQVKYIEYEIRNTIIKYNDGGGAVIGDFSEFPLDFYYKNQCQYSIFTRKLENVYNIKGMRKNLIFKKR